MGNPLAGIGMGSNRSQLKHSTIVQIGDAFSAGLSVAGLVRSDNPKQLKTLAIGLYEELE